MFWVRSKHGWLAAFAAIGFLYTLYPASVLAEPSAESEKSYLGVELHDGTGQGFANPGEAYPRGAEVKKVEPKSPADEAGLKRGDLVIAAGGKPISGSKQLLKIIAGIKPGAEVKIEVLRQGKRRAGTVKLGVKPDATVPEQPNGEPQTERPVPAMAAPQQQAALPPQKQPATSPQQQQAALPPKPRETTLPQQQTTLAQLDSLASTKCGQGRPAEALELWRQALALRKLQLGEENPDTGTGYLNVARGEESVGRNAEAELNYQRAIDLLDSMSTADAPQMADALDGLGRLYGTMAKQQLAEPLLKRAKQIRDRTQGNANPGASGKCETAAAAGQKEKAAGSWQPVR